MTTSVHQLDDGAWVSVNDERVVGVSDLWRLDSGFCDCRVTDLLTEGFVAVSVAPPAVEARVAGQCIACGQQGVTDWLALGHVDPATGRFRAVSPDSVRRPRSAALPE